MQVDLDVELQKRKEKILTLKAEIEAIKAAKDVLEGKAGTKHQETEPVEPDKDE